MLFFLFFFFTEYSNKWYIILAYLSLDVIIIPADVIAIILDHIAIVAIVVICDY